MGYTIFFSHSSSDGRRAKRIANQVQQAGINVYLFEHDPQPGTTLNNKIQNAIVQSDAMVVLLTRKSQSSAYVNQEIGFAAAHRKPVVPLVMSSVSRRKLAMLEGKECVELDPRHPEKAQTIILNYLKGQQVAKNQKINNQLALLALCVFLLVLLVILSKKK